MACLSENSLLLVWWHGVVLRHPFLHNRVASACSSDYRRCVRSPRAADRTTVRTVVRPINTSLGFPCSTHAKKKKKTIKNRFRGFSGMDTQALSSFFSPSSCSFTQQSVHYYRVPLSTSTSIRAVIPSVRTDTFVGRDRSHSRKARTTGSNLR